MSTLKGPAPLFATLELRRDARHTDYVATAKPRRSSALRQNEVGY
jgi:hypothetical protein